MYTKNLAEAPRPLLPRRAPHPSLRPLFRRFPGDMSLHNCGLF